MNIRSLTGYKKEANKEERTIIALGSTESIDRHGTIVRVDGWNLKNFQKNKVILLNHNYQSKPVARSLWEKKTPEGLLFKVQFADTEEGRELYKLYDEGFMNAFSVGFDAIKEETQKINGRDVTVFTEVELYELSCVTVPSNTDSVMVRGALDGIKSKVIRAEFDKAMESNLKSTSMENTSSENKESEKELMQKSIESLTEELEDSKIINKSLTNDIKSLETNKKIVDINKTPSVVDIFRKVMDKISDEFDGYHYYMNDFYPKNYPDGNIVIEEIDRDWNLVKLIDVEYKYNDGEVEIFGQKEVIEQYVEKKMESINKRLANKKFDEEVSEFAIDDLNSIKKSIDNILNKTKTKDVIPEAELEIEFEQDIEEDAISIDDNDEEEEMNLDDVDFDAVCKSISKENKENMKKFVEKNKNKIDERIAKAKGKMYI